MTYKRRKTKKVDVDAELWDECAFNIKHQSQAELFRLIYNTSAIRGIIGKKDYFGENEYKKLKKRKKR